MNKYGKLLRYELKGILRDPMTLMMLAFPVLLLALSCFVFPRVLQGLPQMNAMTASHASADFLAASDSVHSYMRRIMA